MTKTTVIIGESESDRRARELCAALQEAAKCAVVHFDDDHAAEVLETFAALLLHDAADAVKAGVAAGREMLEAERPATARRRDDQREIYVLDLSTPFYVAIHGNGELRMATWHMGEDGVVSVRLEGELPLQRYDGFPQADAGPFISPAATPEEIAAARKMHPLGCARCLARNIHAALCNQNELYGAFLWHETVEGYNYWSDVSAAPGLSMTAETKLCRYAAIAEWLAGEERA